MAVSEPSPQIFEPTLKITQQWVKNVIDPDAVPEDFPPLVWGAWVFHMDMEIYPARSTVLKQFRKRTILAVLFMIRQKATGRICYRKIMDTTNESWERLSRISVKT